MFLLLLHAIEIVFAMGMAAFSSAMAATLLYQICSDAVA